MQPAKLHKYRVRVIIDRLDEPGTDDADVHVGVVHAKEITTLVNLAKTLTQTFGALDEKGK